jgi:hypothetical protein
VVPTQLQSEKDWTSIVQNKQQEVKIVDKTYLTAKFKAKVEKEQNIIDSIVSDFLLNIDQESFPYYCKSCFNRTT